MKLRPAIIAAVVVVLVAVAGGAILAAVSRDRGVTGPDPSPSASPAASDSATSPSVATPAPTRSDTRSASPKPSPTPSASPSIGTTPSTDPLSEENTLRERAYHDATGHDFSLAPTASDLLGPCTGDVTWAEALPRQFVTTRSVQLEGADGRRVVQHLAQVRSASEARTAAQEIIAEVEDCAAIQGGDFGYADPVTVSADDDAEVVYFPAFDSDQESGGYIVLQTGTRVSVIDVSDDISPAQLNRLAALAVEIAAA